MKQEKLFLCRVTRTRKSFGLKNFVSTFSLPCLVILVENTHIYQLWELKSRSFFAEITFNPPDGVGESLRSLCRVTAVLCERQHAVLHHGRHVWNRRPRHSEVSSESRFRLSVLCACVKENQHSCAQCE